MHTVYILYIFILVIIQWTSASLQMQADDYSSFSLSFSSLSLSLVSEWSRIFLPKNCDIRSQSGRRTVRATLCRRRGKRRWDVKVSQQQLTICKWSQVGHPSDLQCVGQTSTGVAGVTHGVQSFMYKLWRTFHSPLGFHELRHVGGHQQGGHTLGTQTFLLHGLNFPWYNETFDQKHQWDWATFSPVQKYPKHKEFDWGSFTCK